MLLEVRINRLESTVKLVNTRQAACLDIFLRRKVRQWLAMSPSGAARAAGWAGLKPWRRALEKLVCKLV